MTLARLLATGSGRIEFRLQVEGWPYEYVTAQWMTRTITSGTYAGRVRIGGLKRDGIGFEEDTSPPHCDIDGKGFVAKIVDDYSQTVCASLIAKPTVDTFITSDVTTAATTINVSSVTGFSAGQYLHIGTEVVKVSSVGASSLTVTRGKWDTTAQAHYVSGSGEKAFAAYIANKPTGIEGRRVWLYGYGEGDDPQGDGTLIYKGIASSDARLDEDGATWSFHVDPRSSILKQKFGSDTSAPFRPRGIFYPTHRPLVFEVHEHADETAASAVTDSARVRVSGFWEDQASFCADLSTFVDDAIQGFSDYANGMRIYAEPFGDVWRWRITVANPGGATPAKFITLMSVSAIDLAQMGWIEDSKPGNQMRDSFSLGDRGSDFYSYLFSDLSYWAFSGLEMIQFTQWVTGSKQLPYDDGLSTVPRGSFGGFGKMEPSGLLAYDFRYPSTQTPATDLSRNTIYLDRDPGPPVGYSTVFGTVSTASGTTNFHRVISAYDAGLYSITTAPAKSKLQGKVHFWTGSTDAQTFISWGFVQKSIYGVTSDLQSISATYCNLGIVPLITSDDFASTFAANIADAIQKRPWAQVRSYISRKKRTLLDLYRNDLKLIGMFLCSDQYGAINASTHRFVSPTEVVSGSVGADEILISESAPTWERVGGSGYVNTVECSTDYNPNEDRYTGPTIIVRDVASVSEHRLSNSVKIEPVSFGSETWDDIADVWRPLVAYYGGDAATVGVDVPLTLFTVAVGDPVRITSDRIPDPSTGTRGTTASGIVIGRRWDMSTGIGRLTILVSYIGAAGYAPTAYVSAKSLVSGFTYDLTVSTSAPGSGPSMYASGEAVTDHFEAGDKVLVWQWDNAAPTTAAGTVVSVSASTIRVTFGGAFGGAPSASDPYAISFDDAATVATDTSQIPYAFFAGTNGKISFTTAISARRFGP